MYNRMIKKLKWDIIFTAAFLLTLGVFSFIQ